MRSTADAIRADAIMPQATASPCRKWRYAGLGLERVADGVAEVQHSAQAIFALVGGNYFGFQPDGFCDDPFQL